MERLTERDEVRAELRALEERVEDELRRMGKALASSRRDLKTGLRNGLAEVQAAIPPPAALSDSRLKAVEQRLGRSDHDMSEWGELHAALDVGLGSLGLSWQR